jgi:hypothetical protein
MKTNEKGYRADLKYFAVSENTIHQSSVPRAVELSRGIIVASLESSDFNWLTSFLPLTTTELKNHDNPI